MLNVHLVADALLRCPVLTTSHLTLAGTLYQLPTMESLQGMTLVDAQAGRFVRDWQLAEL